MRLLRPSRIGTGFFIVLTSMKETVETGLTLEERVASIVEEILTDPKLFLVGVTVRGVKGSRVVEVYVDGDEAVGLDVLAGLSREISFMLDTEDFIAGRYRLQVSSPGLDRPLEQKRQYVKHVGRTLRIKFEDADGISSLEGELSKTDAEFIVLTLADGSTREIAFDKVSEAKIVLPW